MPFFRSIDLVPFDHGVETVQVLLVELLWAREAKEHVLVLVAPAGAVHPLETAVQEGGEALFVRPRTLAQTGELQES